VTVTAPVAVGGKPETVTARLPVLGPLGSFPPQAATRRTIDHEMGRR
jgi:hypothetical protein